MTTHTARPISSRSTERGSALVGVLLLLLMMSALAAALGVSGQTETLVVRNHELRAQARAAAEAGLNRAVQVAVTYLRTIDPDSIAGMLDVLLTDTSALAGVTWGAAVPFAESADTADEYEVYLMDEDDPDRDVVTTINTDADLTNDEDGSELTDANTTIVVRAIGRARDGTTVTLEALLSPVQLGAIITDGDLDISGNVEVTGGPHAGVHSNGDLTIDGSAEISGSMTASGEYDGPVGGTGHAPEKPIPPIRASDYRHHADYVLTDTGQVELPDGTQLCDASSSQHACRGAYGWSFNNGTWSIGAQGNPLGTYYVEGMADIGGNGTYNITVIAEGSIDVSGSPTLTADTDELLFVTDADLDISGGIDTNVVVQGQILVHEQVSISGNATLGGQLVVENATSLDPFVDANAISGSVVIDYNGTLGTNMFFVVGWREVR